MGTDSIYKCACDYISAKAYTHKRLKKTTEMTPDYLRDKGIFLEDDELPIVGVIHPAPTASTRQFFLLTNKYIHYQNLQQMPPWYCQGIVSFLIGPLVSLLMLRDMQTGKIPFNPCWNLNISEKGNRASAAYCGNALTLNNNFLGLIIVGYLSSDKEMVGYLNGLFGYIQNAFNNNNNFNNANNNYIQNNGNLNDGNNCNNYNQNNGNNYNNNQNNGSNLNNGNY